MKKPLVAIVDDDAPFASYLRTFLSLRGYEARCYARGDELLAAMKQAEGPDVVLLDVMMPGLDGLATLRAQPRLDDRRGRALGGSRLRRQARRSGRTWRNRTRRRDQERDRKEPAG